MTQRKIINRNSKEDYRQSGQNEASEKSRVLLGSSKLIAGLRNDGIAAFKQLAVDEEKLVWKWCKEVIKRYRRVLDADPKNIKDAKSLPFSKEDIKLAITLVLPLYISKDMQSTVKMLRTAYKELGAFQAIDPEDKEWVSSTTEKTDQVSSKQNQAALRAHGKYMKLVVSEKKALVQEINRFVIKLQALKSKGSL
jgi:hypothetical protein